MVRKLSLALLTAVIVSVALWLSFQGLMDGVSLPAGLVLIVFAAAFGAGLLVVSLGNASVEQPVSSRSSTGTVVEEDVEDGRERGVVKWFNVKKGFGFITWDNGEDVFVHFRSIRGQGHRSLAEGQRVKFTVVRGDKGPQAEDVSAVQ
ncbi:MULTISPECIES: cold-shock protein [unclassified Oceanobacter]|jgi:CspA family cold shock protein|uniref:cold-shock protein n=1 Tax=unclassified Oceanobacter TaxID=2620260 RepID=UPI0026E1E281|nr:MULTISPECIES: cold shock domain-containing protein [unclassified Oceanobacter]MDO6682566.1 cold shock domain-containing protein [Oceanobacter sp. 5_MG-2023]MDP2506782.1 cold shock domain-containing protein [Oceanobacter sp. 3_MG-2023]MDP2547909.1 cold shock domain-containing protein [Oceanobacter sp. 4_MG-2023]MDP2608799.1 cold shock domain-containing protein [Oceanobacter sp. 1_MG-2023]MDP2611959.1 cold shock domain-containing protein [Oceanobacter sp. 2_MG-2023]